MTDFENKDLNGQENTAQPTEPAAKEPAAPQLTLEPDPVPPTNPVPEAAAPAASTEAFHMPEPPKAPEPPQHQQTPPQYSAPQYQQGQPYGQPPQQPYYNNAAAAKPLYNVPPAGYVQKSRLAAGLIALFLGTFGIHNYYLGFNTRATIQLVVALAGGLITCGVATMAMTVWGFVEGILILSASPTNPSRLYDGNGVILKD